MVTTAAALKTIGLYKDAALQGVATAQYAAARHRLKRRNGESVDTPTNFGGYDIAILRCKAKRWWARPTDRHERRGLLWHGVARGDVLDVSKLAAREALAAVKWYVDDLLIGTLDASRWGILRAEKSTSYRLPRRTYPTIRRYDFALIDNLQIIPRACDDILGSITLLTMIGLRRRS